MWIADTAATVHSTPCTIGLKNVRQATQCEAITMGNGAKEQASMVGDLPGMLCDKHGNQIGRGVLQQVKIIQNGQFNLFLISKMMKQGWELSGSQKEMVILKGKNRIVFDIVIPTTEGVLYAIYHRWDANNELAAANNDKTEGPKMSVKKAHKLLGHPNEQATRDTAHQLGWQLTRGELGPCDACTEAKAKQKNLHTKMPEEVKKADKPNGQVYLNITTIKKHKKFPAPTNPNWRMLVDEATKMKFLHFFKTKDAMVKPTLALFYKWGERGHPVKIVRLDNAGKNKLLAQQSEQADWKLNIAFEFTGCATPQRNSRAEVGIATIANKGRALMAAAGCPLKQRLRLVGEAFTTATLLDGLVVTTLAGKTAT